MSTPLANNPPPLVGSPVLPLSPPAAPNAPASSCSVMPPPPPGPNRFPGDLEDGGHAWSGRFGAWMVDSGCWAWLSSAAVHATILVILSLVILATPTDEPLWVFGAFDAPPVEDLVMDLNEIPLEGSAPSLGPFESGDGIAAPGPRDGALGSPTGTATSPSIGGGHFSARAVDALAPTGETAGGFESLSNPLASRGGGLDGRTLENRRAMALAGGGTEQSEAAVEAALAWFAEHQWPDGGWRFDLEKCPGCEGYCRNSGNHTSSTAATGLALLSFLGAGYTQEDGKYQEVVSRGLYFLREHMTLTSHGGDLRDNSAALELEIPLGGLIGPAQLAAARRDSMYSHGIASLALTEAYAMTRDRGLREPAQNAVKFIINAQFDDGGWRYSPKFEAPAAGDMTVSGWQVAVLKSATLAGIDVPYEVWMKINDFLDGIQDDGGSTYLYLRQDSGTPATTAIGLLCRMVNGWPREHAPLQRGVAKLGAQTPQRNNMYFNYYASQVLHHMGGAHWEKWNPKMREYLVKSQAAEGHEAGSWYFQESTARPGPALHHRDGHHDAGGLLPLYAVVQRGICGSGSVNLKA